MSTPQKEFWRLAVQAVIAALLAINTFLLTQMWTDIREIRVEQSRFKSTVQTDYVTKEDLIRFYRKVQ